MSQYLFLFTIGPVQTFISQARKTQDLYAGSKLLSDLIACAIAKGKENGCQLIFPADGIDSKPNRFLATVKKQDKTEMEEAGKAVENSVKEEFEKRATESLKKALQEAKETNIDKKKICHNSIKQITDFLQIYWVAIPHNNDNEYQKDFDNTEKTLGAIKNTRIFKQIEVNGEFGERGRKCSLCGERNVLFYKEIVIREEGKPNKYKTPAYIQDGAVCLNSDKLEEGEGLCAVCCTKRFYKAGDFPSTAEISLMDALKVVRIEKQNEFKGLFNFERGSFDPQLYYKENLTEKYLEKYKINRNCKLEKVLDKQKEIEKSAGTLPKYYALMVFDGDSMGKWLSGKKLKKGVDLQDFHNKFSERLGKFAKWSADDKDGYLKEPFGRTVYAGGDDFVGFINLNHLFAVLKELRTKFKEKVSEPLKGYFKDDDEITFSAGITIAHYKEPLSEVLKKTRAMEKEAKKVDEKNAFALAVLKHSGEISETVYKWDKLEKISALTDALKYECFSNTFIKNLNLELRQLMNEKKEIPTDSVYEKMFEAEAKRLIKRSCMLKKEDKEKDDAYEDRKKTAINELKENVISLYEKKAENFLSALNIADFLHRKGGVA